MRLSPKKIENLARAICRALETNPELDLGETPDKIQHLIRQVIMEDLKVEEQIEEEARKLLEEHMTEIQRKGASFDTLLRKTKQKIAQERRVVL